MPHPTLNFAESPAKDDKQHLTVSAAVRRFNTYLQETEHLITSSGVKEPGPRGFDVNVKGWLKTMNNRMERKNEANGGEQGGEGKEVKVFKVSDNPKKNGEPCDIDQENEEEKMDVDEEPTDTSKDLMSKDNEKMM